MPKKNVASSGFTAVQAGRIVPAGEKPAETAPAKKKPAKKDSPKKRGGGVTNVSTGNACVGVQTDVVVGDLNIQMGGGR